MPSTYTYGADLSVALDRVRFTLGDTDMTTGVALLSDQEIEAFLPGGVVEQTTENGACAVLCDALVARFSRMVDVSEGSASASMSQLADRYRQLAKDLRAKVSAASGPTGFFAAPTDTCDIEPAFTRVGGDPRYPL